MLCYLCLHSFKCHSFSKLRQLLIFFFLIFHCLIGTPESSFKILPPILCHRLSGNRKNSFITAKFCLARFILMLFPGGTEQAVCGKGKYLHFPLRHRGKVSDRNLHCGNDRMVVCHFFAVHYPFHIRLRPGRFLKENCFIDCPDHCPCRILHIVR